LFFFSVCRRTPQKKQYERYFAANDVSKGGSFYLQSKIYRAHEQLMEFQKEKRKEEQQQQQQQNANASGEGGSGGTGTGGNEKQ
jgi:hypothetical protein